jgi:FtsH-binding integral membrane protein
MQYQYQHEEEPEAERFAHQGPKATLADSARLQFVKKVYSLLTVQLVFTVLAIFLSCYSPAFARFQQRNRWLAYLNIIATIGSSLGLCTIDSYCRLRTAVEKVTD